MVSLLFHGVENLLITWYCLCSFTLPSAYTLLFLRHSFMWEDHWRKSFDSISSFHIDTQVYMFVILQIHVSMK